MKKRRSPETREMIVQLPFGVHAEEYDDDESHLMMESILDALISSSRLGRVGDRCIEGDNVNIFIHDITEANWGAAVELVLKELARQELLGVTVVAREICWVDEFGEDLESDFEVVWPKDNTQTFSRW